MLKETGGGVVSDSGEAKAQEEEEAEVGRLFLLLNGNKVALGDF